MERWELLCVDNAERGGCGVDNGLDRGRVDVVADDVVESPARDVPTHDTSMDKKSIKPTTRTLQQLRCKLTTAKPMSMTITK